MPASIELFHHRSTHTPNHAQLSIDANTRASHTVNPLLYGKFCEHLGANIYHGMEAQILFNCTFSKWQFSLSNHPDGGVYEASDREQIERRIQTRAERFAWPAATPVIDAYFVGAAYGWFRIGSDETVRFSPDVAPHIEPALISRRAQRVEIIHAPGGIGQWTHLPLHRTHGYEFRIVARSVEETTIQIQLAPVENPEQTAQTTLQLTPEWNTFTGHLELPSEVAADALYRFSLTAENPAHIVIERALLYPDDHIDSADPDIIHLLKESRLPILRWPGGNFVSGYRWRLGIGPVDSRPTVPNPAWEGMEFNLFGTDEFVTFCRNVGCEPMICINAGDGTPEETAAWVEYCNGSTDTPMGRLCAENGHPEPYNLKYWEVGNEIYGHWQVSWTTPEGNVDRYHQFAKKMLAADPSIQLLTCGMGSYDSEWNRHAIKNIGPDLRSLAVHALTGGPVNADTDPIELYHGFMGYASVLEARYATIRGWMIEAGNPVPRLAITEEQLFAHFRGESHPNAKLSPETLPRPNTISEALYHATIVNTCIRLGDFVEMITHSASVNHGGGLGKERERVYPHPIHHGCAMGAALSGGTPIAVHLNSETFSTKNTFGFIPPHENVPVLDAMAVISTNSEIILMLIHRGADCGPVELAINIDGFHAQTEAQTVTLSGEIWYAKNTREEPDKISPQQSSITVTDNQLTLTLAPFSLTRVTLPSR